MKVTARATVPNFRAMEIAEYAVETFGSSFIQSKDPNWELTAVKNGYHIINYYLPLFSATPRCAPLSLTSILHRTAAGWAEFARHYCPNPNNQSAALLLTFPKTDTIQISAIECKATQSIQINIATGKIQYCYTGTRDQMPASPLWGLLNTTWFSVNTWNNWTLHHVKTEHKQWSIDLPLLAGRFGKGPANQTEQTIIDNEVKLSSMRTAYQAAGIRIPLRTYLKNNVIYFNSGRKYALPPLLGKHYRKAAANGVNL